MKANYTHFAGIDVSKSKIDICLIVNMNKAEIHYQCFDQSKSGFSSLRKWLKQMTKNQVDQLLICVENTGRYDDALLHYLSDKGFCVNLENAAAIKTSIRDKRAKNDQLDARHIAIYAMMHQDELTLWEKPRKAIEALKLLLAQRSRMVNALKGLKQAEKEEKHSAWGGCVRTKNYQLGISGLKKDIEHIEVDISKLISADAELNRMFMLIVSIPAIGKITAWHFICYTNEFKQVKSGKQLASYCGVVPFEKTSGSSIRKRPRLPQQANKILKTLLHLCATTSIRMKGTFALYYRRKIEEGKNGLVAINGIRNKMALTIAAVIRNNEPYNENYCYQI